MAHDVSRSLLLLINRLRQKESIWLWFPIFHLPGLVKQEQDTVEVVLRPLNDKQYRQDLEALCERVNAVAPRLPDGRRLHFSVQVKEVARPILDVQKRRVA